MLQERRGGGGGGTSRHDTAGKESRDCRSGGSPSIPVNTLAHAAVVLFRRGWFRRYRGPGGGSTEAVALTTLGVSALGDRGIQRHPAVLSDQTAGLFVVSFSLLGILIGALLVATYCNAQAPSWICSGQSFDNSDASASGEGRSVGPTERKEEWEMAPYASLRSACGILLCFALLGCGRKIGRHYEGQPKARNQVAVVYASPPFCEISSVDGGQVSAAHELELLPGSHVLGVRYYCPVGGGREHASGQLTLEAEPGRAYLLSVDDAGLRNVRFTLTQMGKLRESELRRALRLEPESGVGPDGGVRRLYQGQTKPESEVVMLYMDPTFTHLVDGEYVGSPSRVDLKPGTHTVEIACRPLPGVDHCPSAEAAFAAGAGCTYRLRKATLEDISLRTPRAEMMYRLLEDELWSLSAGLLRVELRQFVSIQDGELALSPGEQPMQNRRDVSRHRDDTVRLYDGPARDRSGVAVVYVDVGLTVSLAGAHIQSLGEAHLLPGDQIIEARFRHRRADGKAEEANARFRLCTEAGGAYVVFAECMRVPGDSVRSDRSYVRFYLAKLTREAAELLRPLLRAEPENEDHEQTGAEP